METTFNFTKTLIDKLPIPEKGMETYKDTKEKGLSLYVTSGGAKTFFVRKRINGRDERVKLGTFPDMTVEQARKKALEVKAKVASGENPNLEKHKIRDEMLFEQLFREYLENTGNEWVILEPHNQVQIDEAIKLIKQLTISN